MCGISGFEFVVILVAAIIILGPDKLPELLRFAGKATRELRRWKGDLGDMTREIQRTLPVEELRQNIQDELQLDRARARVKETEAEIDALRARLKKRVELEEQSGPVDGAQGPATTSDRTSAPAADRPMSGPQPRPMNTAGRGVNPAGDGEGADEEAAPEPALPELRPAAGARAQDQAPAEDPSPETSDEP